MVQSGVHIRRLRAEKAEGVARELHLLDELSSSLGKQRAVLDSKKELQVELALVKDNLKEVVDNYWALIDDCVDVGYETKENARGQKRKPPAAEQLKKMEKIVIEHNGKRARMLVTAVRGAGSSTD